MVVNRGVTLIELLVVGAIASLLIVILLPMLRVARESGKDAVSLANLRTHAGTFNQYAADYDDYFPYFTSPDGPVEIEYGGVVYSVGYFDAHYRWQIALAEYGYDGIAPHPSQIRPGGRHICSYYYSASLLADPAFWDPKTRTGKQQWRATRVGEVLFPARKAVFVEIEPSPPFLLAHPGRRVGLGLVDGAAVSKRVAELVEPHRTGEGTDEAAFFRVGIFGMHTPKGVRGLDIR